MTGWTWWTQIKRQRCLKEIILLYRISRRLQKIDILKYQNYILPNDNIKLNKSIKILIQNELEQFNFEPDDSEYRNKKREITEEEKKIYQEKLDKLPLISNAIQYYDVSYSQHYPRV